MLQCPDCRTENPDDNRFCRKCGAALLRACPECDAEVHIGDSFCGRCGTNLKKVRASPSAQRPKSQSPDSAPLSEKAMADIGSLSERKHVSVLFSDLTGYTSMSEKLDPEEVKEITSRIFGEISKIVTGYDGFIEKFAGDAVMAIFGVPRAHEDDPIRSIKAAREIHKMVDSMSPEIETRIGRPVSMHSGINSGLVVTGEVDMERGAHGIAGDTINLAARLSGLAKPGEILIDGDTWHQVEGYFACEFMETATVKGKTHPVQLYRVLSQKGEPVTVRRLSGVRADLIGRKVEMAELSEAVESVCKGRGRIFSICGPAGTGKSRLVEEFKKGLDLRQIQWFEGHAYAYSQNMPYYPLVDLLNRVFQIEEQDSPGRVNQKIESGIASFGVNADRVIPYVGGLYSLSYPQAEKDSPELWKSRLQSAVLEILSGIAKRAPTVFFLEDLHWADPSFVELLRLACTRIRQPAILLCAYRPTFSLFTGQQMVNIGKYYHEIKLQDLSLSEAHDMLESLLDTERIPSDLKRWVQGKAEGNPFYLEELVNALIESGTLKRDNQSWHFTRPITEVDIPSSLHGLIADRIDRLEYQTKRILQEASVIGRDFLYAILRQITELESRIENDIGHLVRIDLIRTRSLQPEIEYMFKHAVTQEIVYNGLLKKQRRQIHEKIGEVMESLFKDRLAEFFETLAFHFSRGQSVAKAVHYLVKSGEKSLARYAVEEAHQHFKNAYDLLAAKTDLSDKEKTILVDILNSWGYAFYYLGEISQWIALYKTHETLADSLDDKARTGMFNAWMGIALHMAGRSKDSYQYLCKGKELGESSGSQKVIGYACTWLSWTCAELGLYAEGLDFAKKAQEIARLFPADQYLFFKSLSGICYINFFKGKIKALFEDGQRLLKYADLSANSRSKVFGHWFNSFGHFLSGDMRRAQESGEKAIAAAKDPAYIAFPKSTLGLIYLYDGQYEAAEDVLQSGLDFSEKNGMELIASLCRMFIAPVWITNGQMRRGVELLEKTQISLHENQRRTVYGLSEYILGQVYSQIAAGPKPSLPIMVKNAAYLIKTVPFAVKRAEEHFKKSIDVLSEIGANGFLGMANFGLGLFYKTQKQMNPAREYIGKAIEIFAASDAEDYLEQAEKELESLE